MWQRTFHTPKVVSALCSFLIYHALLQPLHTHPSIITWVQASLRTSRRCVREVARSTRRVCVHVSRREDVNVWRCPSRRWLPWGAHI